MSSKALANRIKGNKNLFGNPFAKSTGPSTGPSTKATTARGRFIIMDFCPPAKVYLILAMLSMVYYVSTDQGITWLIMKALIFILWAFLLNILCTSGNQAIAWLMAIIPQCIFLICTIKTSPPNMTAPIAMAQE
jgi:hypothetical protein